MWLRVWNASELILKCFMIKKSSYQDLILATLPIPGNLWKSIQDSEDVTLENSTMAKRRTKLQLF